MGIYKYKGNYGSPDFNAREAAARNRGTTIAGAGGLSFNFSEWVKKFGQPSKARAAMTRRARELAKEMEAYAQANAPWQDRSSKARSGLHAMVKNASATSIQIQLSHREFYGVFLESPGMGTAAANPTPRPGGPYNHRTGKRNRKFPIIEPTINRFGKKAPQIMQEVMKAQFG